VRLLEADVRKLLGLVHDVGELRAPEPFPPNVLDRLRDLIPCINIGYFEWDRDRRLLAVYNQAGFEIPAHDDSMLALGRALPWAANKLRPGTAVRISGLVSRRWLERSAWYQDAWRPIGVVDELKLRLQTDPSTLAGFSLLSERLFSDRDVFMLDLLAPHLKLVRERSDGPAQSSRADLTRREREVLSWVSRGKTNKEIAAVLGVEPSTVRKHLENAFDKLGVHTRTAAVALTFPRSE
jgi:DNA-binding CsgD family transcriptional regulator